MNTNRLYAFQMLTSDNEFVNKVACIKGLRTLTGMGLKDAKEFVEAVQSEAEVNSGPQEKRIPVVELEPHVLYGAISTMEHGGLSASAIENVHTNLRLAIKSAAEMAIKEDKISVAIDLLEIVDELAGD